MPKRRSLTLFGGMIERGGLRNASRSLGYLGAWAMASNKLGHPVTQEEFVKFWLSSDATNTRDRNALRACLPDGWDVPEMLDFVWQNRRSLVSAMTDKSDRNEAMRELSQLPWPLAS